MIRGLWLVLICFLTGALGRVTLQIGIVRTSRHSSERRSPAYSAPEVERSQRLIAARRQSRGGSLDRDVRGADETASEPAWIRRWKDETEAARNLLQRYDAGTLYSKLFGPLPVRPLGVSSHQWSNWREAHPREAERFKEGYVSVFKRVGVVNRSTPNPLGGGQFEALAYVDTAVSGEGVLETIVGGETGDNQLARSYLLKMLARKLGYDVETLPPSILEDFGSLRDRWQDRKAASRRRFWTTVYRVAVQRIEQGMFERDVIAFYSAGGGKLLVVRRGDDHVLEDLTRKMTDLRRRVALQVREAIR